MVRRSARMPTLASDLTLRTPARAAPDRGEQRWGRHRTAARRRRSGPGLPVHRALTEPRPDLLGRVGDERSQQAQQRLEREAQGGAGTTTPVREQASMTSCSAIPPASRSKLCSIVLAAERGDRLGVRYMPSAGHLEASPLRGSASRNATRSTPMRVLRCNCRRSSSPGIRRAVDHARAAPLGLCGGGNERRSTRKAKRLAVSREQQQHRVDDEDRARSAPKPPTRQTQTIVAADAERPRRARRRRRRRVRRSATGRDRRR